MAGDSLLDQHLRFEVDHVPFELSGLHFRQVENVVDETCQPLAFGDGDREKLGAIIFADRRVIVEQLQERAEWRLAAFATRG